MTSEPATAFHPFDDAAIEQSIPARFEQQARAHGDRLAIRWDTGCYTYAGLNATANRLAHRILALSDATAAPVALMFDHGGEALAAIVAVLKAGKFYVVLDPAYPSDRLHYMLADSGVRLLIADAAHRGYARQLCAGTIECVDFDDADPALPDGNLPFHPAPDSLAMLLYTSGSTGRPKGVMHTHRNVLVDVRNLTNGWRVCARDRWLLSASLSFANSVRTVYTALLNGASLYPYDIARKGFGALHGWVLDNELTIVRGVPTFFRNFAATLDPATRFPKVRILSLGGEPMLRADVDAFNLHFAPPCILAHAFGPTECLTVCWNLVPHGTRIVDGKLPIGHPLRDKDVLLLDEYGREVGAGELGEIAVRSRHISPGYWGDPDRTRATFLPDPAGSDARIYLTGDLGRRAPDGKLIHVGRRDFQVKVRGFRIEVAEIETALRGLPGIGDAVVVGHESEPGAQRLYAYYVPTVSPPLSSSELRTHLARTLPDYMIPSAFVAMTALPQTPNGKTDRRLLPAPAPDRREADGPAVPPRSALEAELAAMWADVLGLDSIGVEDRFLDLGGDSLQAARIVARVAARFSLDAPLRALFHARTVAQMAEAVAGATDIRGEALPGPA